MKANKTRYALLGVLSLGPQTGYDIKKFVEATIGHFWSESYGQIYPILRKLVEEGLATVSTRVQDGRPNKKIYNITELGRGQLHQWQAEPTTVSAMRSELLLKLFFGRQIPTTHNVKQVESYRKQLLKLNSYYTHVYEQFNRVDNMNPDDIYWKITLRSGMINSEATTRWCDETLIRLRELETSAPMA